jgi:DNA-binding CsgD family transcriptional regulator
MAKRSSPTNGRSVRSSPESPRAASRAKQVKPAAANGGRAVPGKAPRGSLQRSPPGFPTLARSILEKIDRGVILLDARGTVVDANSIARQVLTIGNGLLLRTGRFAFADAEIDGRFDELLKSSVGKLDVKSDGKLDGARRLVAASVKRPGSPSCRVLVSPIVVDDATPPAAAYIVVIYAPAEQREIAPAVLLEIYGLTRAQADVARQLYAGLSVEETAAELQLSLNTVRTHLKQIFSKCEVQSQAELLHALALGPQSF